MLLLDPTKEYMLRITELNAPISSLPLFGFDDAGAILDEELFRIKQRVAGTTTNTLENGFETTGLNQPFSSSTILLFNLIPLFFILRLNWLA